MRNPLAALAGRKAKVLYRNPDRSTALAVEDENDDVTVIVGPDGSMYEYRIAGLAGMREALEASSPYGKVLVPDDSGRKRWERLEPEPPPETATTPDPFGAPEPAPAPVRDLTPDANASPEPEPSPVQQVSAGVERDARNLSFRVRSHGVMRAGMPPDAEPLRYAIAQQWVVADKDMLLRPGPVYSEPMTELPDERNSRGWGPVRLFGR